MSPDAARLGALIREMDRAAPFDLLDVCGDWLRRSVACERCDLLLVDYGGVSLEAVPEAGEADGPRHRVEGSPAGECFREQRAVTTDGERDEVTIHLPVSIRMERLGVLAVVLPRQRLTPPVRESLTDAANVLAYVLTGARRYTDRFEVARRRRDLSLAAEIQWELLPVLAYDLPAFSVAGALEPTYDIGGDTFDYAVSARRLTISVTDAVGHGLRAALMGSLAVAALRNTRRSGGDISAQADAANRRLAEQFPDSSFVTGLLMEIDVATGSGAVINAGHPVPLLLRDGVVRELRLPPDLPLGLRPEVRHRRHPVQMRGGDRLLLLTDGITEARSPHREAFGTQRVAEFLRARATLAPNELVRHLARAVMEYAGGPPADDATAVCLDWHAAGTVSGASSTTR